MDINHRRAIVKLYPLAALVFFLLLAGPSALAQAEPAATPATLKSLRDKAVEQVVKSAQSQDPFMRANAIEAAQNLPQRVVPLAQLGVQDAHPAVRFSALATIGKLKLRDLAPAVRPLLVDRNESVRAAAMFALRRCGQDVDITPMADMLMKKDPTHRSNAAMLLGMMGDRSAVPMLKELAKTPMPRASAVQAALVRIQVAEAVVTLGDDTALDAVRAGAYSHLDEVRVLAVMMIGRLGDRRMEKGLAQMLIAPPVELQLAAAQSLAQLGHADGLPVVLSQTGSPMETVRAQAAATLGYFNDPRVAPALARLLDDASEQTRLAAAAAVLRPRR